MADSGGGDGPRFLEDVPSKPLGFQHKPQKTNVGLEPFIKQGAAVSGRYERGSAFEALSRKGKALQRELTPSSSAGGKRNRQGKAVASGGGEGKVDARGDGENVEPRNHMAEKGEESHAQTPRQNPTKISTAATARIKASAGAWGGAAMARMAEMKTPKAEAIDTAATTTTRDRSTQNPPATKRPVYCRKIQSSDFSPRQSPHQETRKQHDSPKSNRRSKADYVAPWSDEHSDEESECGVDSDLTSSQNSTTRPSCKQSTRTRRKSNLKAVRVLESPDDESGCEALDDSTSSSDKSTAEQQQRPAREALGVTSKKVTFAKSPPVVHMAQQGKRVSDSSGNLADDEIGSETHSTFTSPEDEKVKSASQSTSRSASKPAVKASSARPPTPWKKAAPSSTKQDADEDDAAHDFRTPPVLQKPEKEDPIELGKENLQAGLETKTQGPTTTALPQQQGRKGIPFAPRPKRKYCELEKSEIEDEGVVLPEPTSNSPSTPALQSETTQATAASKKSAGPVRKKGVAQKVVKKKANKAVY